MDFLQCNPMRDGRSVHFAGMSASQASALTPIAFQLAAAIECYDAQVERMVRHPIDPELYQSVAQRMDEMRMYAASLPRLSVPWVEVMIRHFELTHGLWRAQCGEIGEAELLALRDQQRDAVRVLRQACLKVLGET